MSAVTQDSVQHLLNSMNFPIANAGAETRDDSYGSLFAISNVAVKDECVEVQLNLGIKAESRHRLIGMQIESALEAIGLDSVNLNIESSVLASPCLKRQGQLRDVKNILMVASGKGGVGKSTTAINLALALKAEGAKVGILDADIYGPSMRTMLGVPSNIKPTLVDEKFIEPIKKHGLKSMSVAYMSEEKTPMIWRGPMAVRALQQLLENTLWGELDYLIIDMPPGTGDIHISLAQKVSVSAAVVVTTPQEMALTDARKGIEMFNKVGIPVLGIVENMATHVCSSCGSEEHIFGVGGAQKLARDYGIDVLGSLPLSKQVREHIDAGVPTVVNDPGSKLSASYISLANHVALQLWKTNLSATPAITINVVEA